LDLLLWQNTFTKRETSNKKRVQGGASAKNYVMVMPDADLEGSINNMIGSFYGNAGERCLAGSVLVTLDENHDRVLKAFRKKAAELKLGYGMESGTDMGPLIRKEHLERVENYIDIGIEEGGKMYSMEGCQGVPNIRKVSSWDLRYLIE
jgi:NAD-dependent aldehyde dehydrogenases